MDLDSKLFGPSFDKSNSQYHDGHTHQNLSVLQSKMLSSDEQISHVGQKPFLGVCWESENSGLQKLKKNVFTQHNMNEWKLN